MSSKHDKVLVSSRLQSLQQELQNNLRLRWGVYCIIGLLALYLILVLQDTYNEQQVTLRQLNSRLEELNSLVPEAIWQQRLKEVDEQQDKLRTYLWKARTDGLAQAAVQGTVEQLANQSGLQQVTVRVSAPVEIPGLVQIKRLRLELSGQFKEGSLFKFLSAIEGQMPGLFIEQSQINWGSRNSLRLQLSVLVAMQESP